MDNKPETYKKVDCCYNCTHCELDYSYSACELLVDKVKVGDIDHDYWCEDYKRRGNE